MSNPNGTDHTTAEEAIRGNDKVKALIDEYLSIDYVCAREKRSVQT